MKEKHLIWILIKIILGVCLVYNTSCNNDKNDNNDNMSPTPTKPILTTNVVTNITDGTAICGGNILSNGGSPLISRGVCWHIGNWVPSITDNKTTDGSDLGSFTSEMVGLSHYTLYTVRAYATNSVGTAYGDYFSFMTLNSPIIFNPNASYGSISDIDGNIYKTIIIGSQTWMAENLNVKHYRNGDIIPYITDNTEWGQQSYKGACCDWDNDSSNGHIYGKLYNWYALYDIRNIAPIGWHVATQSEWFALISFLGGGNYAGNKLKESGYNHWNSPNYLATNESGFTALPSNMRMQDGSFFPSYSNCGEAGYWWTTTNYNTNSAYEIEMSCSSSSVIYYYDPKLHGHSVRCIKDY